MYINIISDPWRTSTRGLARKRHGPGYNCRRFVDQYRVGFLVTANEPNFNDCNSTLWFFCKTVNIPQHNNRERGLQLLSLPVFEQSTVIIQGRSRIRREYRWLTEPPGNNFVTRTFVSGGIRRRRVSDQRVLVKVDRSDDRRHARGVSQFGFCRVVQSLQCTNSCWTNDIDRLLAHRPRMKRT